MRVYVASSLKNAQKVADLQKELVEMGYSLSRDWATPYLERNGQQMENWEVYTEINRQVQAILHKTDLLILILPAGGGGHVEMGMAIGRGIPVLIWAGNEELVGFHMTDCVIHIYNKPALLVALRGLIAGGEFSRNFRMMATRVLQPEQANALWPEAG